MGRPESNRIEREGSQPVKAHQILEAGLGHMKDRSATYDKPAGERSMGATVDAFRAITGHDLTEEQGWLFMGLLKMVRSQQGGFRADNYEDLAAYAGLQGEAAWAERTNQDFGQQNTIDCRTKEERAADIGRQLADGVRRAASGAVCNDPRTVVGLDVSFPTERHMNFAPEKRSVQRGDCGYPYQGLPRQHCKHHYAEASHA